MQSTSLGRADAAISKRDNIPPSLELKFHGEPLDCLWIWELNPSFTHQETETEKDQLIQGY